MCASRRRVGTTAVVVVSALLGCSCRDCAPGHTRSATCGSVCVCLLFISRCMRPKEPWQRLAAALADSSAFQTPPLHDRALSPTTMGYTGAPLLLLPISAGQKKSNRRQGKNTKEKYSLGRTRPALFTLRGPGDLLAPVLINSNLGHLSRRPAPHPRALQEFQNCPYGLLPPQPPQSRRPPVLPEAVPSHSCPQPPYLGGSRPGTP